MRLHGHRVRQAKIGSQGLSFHYLNGYHAPWLRLTLNAMKRACKAVMLHPPAHPAEQSCAGGGTRTHSRIVVMPNKPPWVMGLAQQGMGQGWTPGLVIQRASRKYPGEPCGPTHNAKQLPG